MLSTSTSPNTRPTCYFSIVPPSYDHYSIETPCYSPSFSPAETPEDPIHPLLAYRYNNSTSPTWWTTQTSTLPSVLQMQTNAANGYTSRPRPVPVQNVLHVTSEDSTDSDGCSSSSSSTDSSLDLARCSRCQRTPSLGVDGQGKSNMVQYGLNLWYCNRCATMVGLGNR